MMVLSRHTREYHELYRYTRKNEIYRVKNSYIINIHQPSDWWFITTHHNMITARHWIHWRFDNVIAASCSTVEGR